MSTYNIGFIFFNEEISKITSILSLDMHFICFSVLTVKLQAASWPGLLHHSVEPQSELCSQGPSRRCCRR